LKKVGYIYHPIYTQHIPPREHPERPERVEAIDTALTPLKDKLISVPPRRATAREIALVHDFYYPQEIMDLCSAGGTWLDPDTYCMERSYEVASYAAGAGLQAIDWIKDGKVERVFGNIRPPGHHAEYSKAMGFCIFNNIAITARYAQQNGYEKVFIVDFDAHHGNGTQKAFWEDDTVFYFSTHQYPFYPGTGSKEEKGAGKGYGYTYNVPLPAGTGDEEYEVIYGEILPSLINKFKPDIILVSAGYDLHVEDPLAYLEVSTEGIGKITNYILKSANVPYVFLLEGGYNLSALGESAKITVENMLFAD